MAHSRPMTPKNPAQPWRSVVVMTVAEATALFASAARMEQFNIGVLLLVLNGGTFQALYFKAQQGNTFATFQQLFAAQEINDFQPDEILGTNSTGTIVSLPYIEVLEQIQAEGAMGVQYQQTALKTAVASGTVAQINGGSGVFTAPIVGQMAFCTDATGGAKPCWYTGTIWVTADGVLLA